jgi:hypothetical protein
VGVPLSTRGARVVVTVEQQVRLRLLRRST